MSLIFAKPGSKVRLLTVRAGRELKARLAALGLMPGVQMEVLSSGQCGPFVVAINRSRVVLGRGMAQKIEVE